MLREVAPSFWSAVVLVSDTRYAVRQTFSDKATWPNPADDSEEESRD